MQGGPEHRPRAERGGLVREAAACDHRTLVRSAEACLDTSDMPLDIAVIEGLTPKQKPTGSFEVSGLSFDSGFLEVRLDDQQVTAVVTPDGVATSVEWAGDHDGVTLTRVSR